MKTSIGDAFGNAVKPFTVQIVGYDRSPTPALILASGGEVERISLSTGEKIGYRLGDRHCAGRLNGDGHVSCPDHRTPRCEIHSRSWVCARCRGRCSLPIHACSAPHAVYLALFAPDLIKVGVTRRRRIEHRLAEQGADRGAVLEHVVNGRIARRIERQLANRYPDRVGVRLKVNSLAASVDTGTWSSQLNRYNPVQTYRLSYGFSVTQQPIPATIAYGTVIGVKGRLLVLDHGGTEYVTDLRELVGFNVVDSPDEGPIVQQGLDAFVQ